jgi:hypothetical protein
LFPIFFFDLEEKNRKAGSCSAILRHSTGTFLKRRIFVGEGKASKALK